MRILILLLFALVLSACHSNFQQPQTNELGYLPVGDDADVRITVNQGIDTNQFKQTLYVSTDLHGIANWAAYQDYIMEAFRQLDFFCDVVTRQPTVYINTPPPLPTKRYDENKAWIDVVDPVSMPDVVKTYGPTVLVAKAILRSKSDDYGDMNAFNFQLQIIDPSTSVVLFQGSKSGGNTLGIDDNVINPVLNYAKGYLQAYDPTFVPNHPPTWTIPDDTPATPFSYRGGM